MRNLEREISKVARKVVKKVVSGEEKEVKVSKKNLSDFLGVPKFKSGELESEDRVGIVTGLAWTEYGGEILKIETATCPVKEECKSQENLEMLCRNQLKQQNHMLDQKA